MPSRRCPHCKVVSSYDVGGEKNLFSRKTNTRIRFDKCRDEDCQCTVAVVYQPAEGNTIVDIYPKLETDPDELLPADVKTAFGQALKSLNEEIWDGCVTLCRRALEEAMNDLKAEGGGLKRKIKNLAAQNRITPALSNWAHEGRLAGNLGAHGFEERKWSTESDAQEIVEFSKWFFRYVYVLPRQLEQRRKRLAEEPKRQSAEESAPEAEG